MKRFFTLALVGALVLGVSSIAYANFCAFDPVPAASLLFPFVAFDYNNPTNGTTTLMAITNVSHEAQVVHVTIWTDYSEPVLDFNILLSGYDVQTMNIRDILYYGTLPSTGTTADLLVAPNASPLANGPVNESNNEVPIPPYLDDAHGTNTLSPARCSPTMAAYPDYPPIEQGVLDQLRAFLQASQTSEREHDNCAGTTAPLVPDDWFQARTTADVTWMYITADVVWQCNREFPDTAIYWTFNDADPLSFGFATSPSGQKRVTNVLMGDVFWVNDAARYSEADNAVHLEADPYFDNVVTITPALEGVSFFYRYSTSAGAQSDMREPLPTGWAFRYIGYQNTAVHTWIRAFKQGTNLPSTVPQLGQVGENRVVDLSADPELLPTSLIAYDCIAYTYFAWDEDENVNTTIDTPYSFPGAPLVTPNLLPLETQEVDVDQFNMVDTNGWVMFLWPASNWDPLDSWNRVDWYQTWMGVKYGAYGNYTAALSGNVVANFNCYSDQVFPGLGLGVWYVDPLDGYKTSPNVY